MLRSTGRFTWVLLLIIAAWPVAAQAEVIQFRISGEILAEPFADPDGDLGSIDAGDQFTGFFRYDADTPELGGGVDPHNGAYFVPIGFVPLSFDVGEMTFQTDPAPDFPLSIGVSDDFDDGLVVSDSIAIYDESPLPPEGFAGTPVELGLSFYSSDPSVLSDISLPRQYNLSDWEEVIVFFGASSSETGQWIEFIGRIDELEPTEYAPELQAGDANQDLEFDQLDLVQVQQQALYLTGQPATWGGGDWNGAPGGSPGSPPVGDGLFNQQDIVAALQNSLYLSGPYAALGTGGHSGDGQTSIGDLVYVPEPTSIALLWLGLLGLAGRRTSRRR
jgi:hypothetical protein